MSNWRHRPSLGSPLDPTPTFWNPINILRLFDLCRSPFISRDIEQEPTTPCPTTGPPAPHREPAGLRRPNHDTRNPNQGRAYHRHSPPQDHHHHSKQGRAYHRHSPPQDHHHHSNWVRTSPRLHITTLAPSFLKCIHPGGLSTLITPTPHNHTITHATDAHYFPHPHIITDPPTPHIDHYTTTTTIIDPHTHIKPQNTPDLDTHTHNHLDHIDHLLNPPAHLHHHHHQHTPSTLHQMPPPVKKPNNTSE